MRLNVGTSLELGLNLALDTCNFNSGLDAFQLRRHFRDRKPSGRVTRQMKLHGLRRINRIAFLGL